MISQSGALLVTKDPMQRLGVNRFVPGHPTTLADPLTMLVVEARVPITAATLVVGTHLVVFGDFGDHVYYVSKCDVRYLVK